jgi:hypothetical protein
MVDDERVMIRFEFHLSISPERFLDYYRGTARQVVARCRNGENIQFPAALLRPFVTPAGVQGDFVLTCDESLRGANLQRAPGNRG